MSFTSDRTAPHDTRDPTPYAGGHRYPGQPNTMNRTVLFCCNSVFGMVNFRGGVIRHLVAQGDRVVVVAPRDDYVGTLTSLGAEYQEWKLSGRGTRVLDEVAAIRQLGRIYREVRPCVAFHFTVKPVIYGAVVARRLRIPFISVLTGLGYAFINRNWVSVAAVLLYRYTLRWSFEVWLLNREDGHAMRRRGLLRGGRIRLLPGEGVDTAHFCPASAAPHNPQTRFLLIARLLRDKGILEFVEAARILRDRGVDAHFALLGQADADNPTAISRADVVGWEREGLLTYLGVEKDVRPFIEAADCVVLPSYREGLPRTLLEASAMARPIIATDVPGCRDIVVDGVTGYLCKVKDARDFADKMEQMVLAGSAGRAALGEQGRRFVSTNFDERLVIDHYEAVLDALPRQAAHQAPRAGLGVES